MDPCLPPKFSSLAFPVAILKLANSHLTGLKSFCLSDSTHPLTSLIVSPYISKLDIDFPDLYETMFTKWSILFVVANFIVCGAASLFTQSPLLSYKGSYDDQTGGRFLSLQYSPN